MAILFKGSLGAGPHGVSASSYAFVTLATTMEADEIGILISVSDNASTVSGADNGETASVTDTSGNTWTKVSEYTNSPTATANDGVTVSIWMTVADAQLPIGGTITITFTSARTQKACTAEIWTVAAGGILQLSTAPIVNLTTGLADYGAATFSGLPLKERLYYRGLGKEANVTTFPTASSGFTSMGGTRSANIATAVIVRGEYRINTSTGETSDPTHSAIGDTAGIFLALEEVIPNPSIESGKATLTLTGLAPSLALRIGMPSEP